MKEGESYLSNEQGERHLDIENIFHLSSGTVGSFNWKGEMGN